MNEQPLRLQNKLELQMFLQKFFRTEKREKSKNYKEPESRSLWSETESMMLLHLRKQT